MKRSPISREGSGNAKLERRLQRLCDRYGLAESQKARLATILAALANDQRAPTTVREEDAALDMHLADSLVALGVSEVKEAKRIADIGAGAGFPGLPLALALPSAKVSLIESQSRKCDFLMDLCRSAEIDNATIVCARVEQWSEGAGVNEVVLARAVAAPAVVLEYAAPILGLDGLLIDWRGRRNPGEEQAALGAASELGLERVDVLQVDPFEGVRDHHLHLYRKVSATPERFPRRAGMARKRPLGL